MWYYSKFLTIKKLIVKNFLTIYRVITLICAAQNTSSYIVSKSLRFSLWTSQSKINPF